MGMNSLKLTVCLSAFTSVVFIGNAKAEFGQYTVTDLGTTGGNYSMPYDINEAGEVVGISRVAGSNVPHAFFWRKGQPMMDLGVGHAMGLNDQHAIVGTIANGNIGVWDTESAVFPLPAKDSGIKSADLVSEVSDSRLSSKINQAGEIIAQANSGPYKGWSVRWANGNVTPLGKFNFCEGGRFSAAVNNRGVFAFTDDNNGSSGKLWSRGQISMLPLQYMDTLRYPVAMNDLGEIVTISVDYGSFYFSQISGELRTLPLTPRDINNGGYIVGGGGYGDISFKKPYAGSAEIYSIQDDEYADLNTLIPEGSGWSLGTATAINNAGQIAGVGINPNGEMHAYLLTPVKAN